MRQVIRLCGAFIFIAAFAMIGYAAAFSVAEYQNHKTEEQLVQQFHHLNNTSLLSACDQFEYAGQDTLRITCRSDVATFVRDELGVMGGDISEVVLLYKQRDTPMSNGAVRE